MKIYFEKEIAINDSVNQKLKMPFADFFQNGYS